MKLKDLVGEASQELISKTEDFVLSVAEAFELGPITWTCETALTRQYR